MVEVNDKIYILGGWQNNRNVTNYISKDVYEFNLQNNKLKKVYKDKMYVAGGFYKNPENDNIYFNSIDVYNPASDSIK